MTSQDLWAQVAETLARYNLLKHPFYQAWSKGELTPGQLAFYGAQYGKHVAAFPTYLTRLHSRLEDGPARRAILANAADEESETASHADLWRQFAEGIGANAGPGIEVEEVTALVETFRAIAERASLPQALGAFYAYESQVPEVAREKLSGLKKFYGASERMGEYFAIHMTADLHHSAVWRRLIDRRLADEPGCGAEVLEGVECASAALWNALDGIETARVSLP